MDHGGHEGHDMPMARCKMNMLWNTDIIDTCIVFRSWHIRTSTGFVLSCLAIVALGVLYEYLRGVQRALDRRIALSLANAGAAGKAKGKDRSRSRSREGDSGLGLSSSSEGNVAIVDVGEGDSEEAGLLTGRRVLKSALTGTPVPPVSRALRAAVYGATVFLSFFLMLVFMTYNAYLIFATVLGAALGHYVFSATLNVDAILAESSDGGKGMACH